MEKRPYRQTRRAAQAEGTRQRVLAAARDQLMSVGAFTIEAVAARSGVSRVTVYNQFGGRGALREAVFDDLAAGGGLYELPTVFAEQDPLDAVARLIDIFCGFYAANRLTLRRLNALAALAAGDGERATDRNQRRGQILVRLLTRAARLPQYQGLPIEETAAVLQALTSFEFFEQLSATPAVGADAASHIRALAVALLRV